MTVLQRLGQTNAAHEMVSRSREFAEYAVALMRAKGNPETALYDAEANGLPQRVKATLKAAVSGATTSTADDLAPLRILSQGFTATLTNACFDSVLR